MQNTTSVETSPAPKRGRGRPRIAHPLTPAERAKRYRERKRTAARVENKSDVTINVPNEIEATAAAAIGTATGTAIRTATGAGIAADMEAEMRRLRSEVMALREFARQRYNEVEQLQQANESALAENRRRAQEVDALRQRYRDMRGIADYFIEARHNKKAIPHDVFLNMWNSFLKIDASIKL